MPASYYRAGKFGEQSDAEVLAKRGDQGVSGVYFTWRGKQRKRPGRSPTPRPCAELTAEHSLNRCDNIASPQTCQVFPRQMKYTLFLPLFALSLTM